MEPVAATTTTTTRAPSTTPYTGPTPTVRAEEEEQAAVIQGKDQDGHEDVYFKGFHSESNVGRHSIT